MKKPDWDDSTQDDRLVESTHSSVQTYRGVLLDVRKDTARLPDQALSDREWIKHPGACAVLPVFEDGTLMMIRQFRYPLRKVFLEVPAGKIDPGESIRATAERELSEETGVTATRLVHCGSFHPCIGYSDEVIHVFAAWDLKQDAHRMDDDEFLLPIRVPFAEALAYSRQGGIGDAKTMCSLELAADWWRREGPFDIGLDG